MLVFSSGDMFQQDFDIRVNTVNCVGVMGAGVALAFKNRYPEMFYEYRRKCSAGQIEPGKLHVWEKLPGSCIINLPTKRHWRNKSRFEDLEAGLKELRRFLAPLGKVSVALPALGCGRGGLNWKSVKCLIQKHLKGLAAKVTVFTPEDLGRLGRKTDAN